MTHGYQKFKCREDAIGSIRVLKGRLAAANISHLLELLDLSNAFASVDHNHLDAVMSHFIEPEDFDLAQLRYRDTFFVIDCPDGQLELQNKCGGLQGDVYMVYAWLSAFAPLVANWQSSQVTFDPFYRTSICRSPKGTSSD